MDLASETGLKISMDTCEVICHTGKDLHPEAKRFAILCFYKTQPDVAEFYERWPADADFPDDRLFGDGIADLEPTGAEYDPDDATPWSWDLKTDLFAQDFEWSEFLDELKRRGPE